MSYPNGRTGLGRELITRDVMTPDEGQPTASHVVCLRSLKTRPSDSPKHDAKIMPRPRQHAYLHAICQRPYRDAMQPSI